MATPGEKLLSSLRRTKSKSALYNVVPDYFNDDERTAYDWMRDFVETHDRWPTAETFKRETGISPVITREPLGYYMDDARKAVLFETLHQPFADIREALASHDPDQVLAIMAEAQRAAAMLNARQQGVVTWGESMRQVKDDYDIARTTKGGLRGIDTGYAYLNEATEGFQRSNLYSFVARTGVGKTSKLLAMALAARRAGYSVLFLSMEMGIVQVARRAFGIETGYDPRLMRSAKFSTAVEREMQGQLTAMESEEGPNWYWLAGNFKKTVPALKIAAYETQADIIFADASYLLKPEDRTRKNQRHEILNDVMEGLADITTSTDRPLVQSIQFNRQAVKGKRDDDTGDDQNRRNPLAHLDLTKIGGTDTVGQISAVVCGLAEGDAPYQRTRRYCGLLKGREGEEGWYCYNYVWRPTNLTQLYDHRQARDEAALVGRANRPSMDYMNSEI